MRIKEMLERSMKTMDGIRKFDKINLHSIDDLCDSDKTMACLYKSLKFMGIDLDDYFCNASLRMYQYLRKKERDKVKRRERKIEIDKENILFIVETALAYCKFVDDHSKTFKYLYSKSEHRESAMSFNEQIKIVQTINALALFDNKTMWDFTVREAIETFEKYVSDYKEVSLHED